MVQLNVNVNGVVFILLQIWCLYSPNCPMALKAITTTVEQNGQGTKRELSAAN